MPPRAGKRAPEEARLSDLLRAEFVLLSLAARDKDDCFRQMLRPFVSEGVLNPEQYEDLLGAVFRREELQCTAVGEGIALPHAYHPALRENFLALARLAHPIDFDTPDCQKVGLVFLLVGPKRDPTEHLQILARIARALRDAAFHAALRHAPDAATILAALRAAETRRG